MQISLPSVPMGHRRSSWHVGFKNPPNLSMTLIWGSVSIFYLPTLSVVSGLFRHLCGFPPPPPPPLPVLFFRRKPHPDGGCCNPLAPFYVPLKLTKLQQWSHLHIVGTRRVTPVKEDLHPLVYAVDYVHTKEGASRKGLVVFPLKAVIVTWLCGHGPDEGPLIDQVVPRHKHKFTCTMTDLLYGGHHMEPLVHQLSCVLLGEAIPSHCQEDLDPYCALMCVCGYGRY